MAHNEESNIFDLLHRVSAEDIPGIDIARIIVVSSGSTDKTDQIVAEFKKTDTRVTLITQDKRYGKCAAINLFLKECQDGALVLLLSGDILPEKGAVKSLLLPLLDEDVGMTGGRPRPVNDENSFFGFTAHLIWNVHHHIALETPKLGEAVAFVKVMDQIPEDLAVDEAAIETFVLKKGLKLRYCPDAIIRNQGPENLSDFIKQRRRIQAGHIHLKEKLGYEVSTFGLKPSIKALASAFKWNLRYIFWTPLACLLIYWGRFLGSLDYRRGKLHTVWNIAESTKSELSKKSTKG